ncbi:MAG: response regulator transcription factor [Prevotella sp.]|jgi:DNA-binding response OmpR family regulator|nr:response regulator transcription factor [Prevotella sp.]MCI1281086.1 response regulator transcription factor [Prevotella sp.]
MKILIVEDERRLSDSIVKFLSADEYLCEQAFTISDALMKVGVYDYDCVLLDLMLPDGNGLDVLRHIKQHKPDTGVIIVSAKDSVDDKIEGLEIGADDYISKPFNLSELKIRVFALMRRRYSHNNNLLKSGPVEINMQSKEAKANGQMLSLTKTEYELLLFLVCNSGKVISKMAIAEHLTGEMADMMDNFNIVFTHIKNLKRKLDSTGCPECIRTLYGAGYKWIV